MYKLLGKAIVGAEKGLDKAVKGAEIGLGKLKKWAKEKENQPKVVKEKQTMHYMKRVDLPVNEDCVFQADGITFVGCYIGNMYNQTQIATEYGLLNLDKSVEVKVLRKATQDESMRLASTKHKVKNHHVLRFLGLRDLAF